MIPFDDITNLIINLEKDKNPERNCVGNGYILDLNKKYMYLAQKDVKNLSEFRMVEMWQEDQKYVRASDHRWTYPLTDLPDSKL